MVMAGDCDYDAAYLPVSFQPGVVTGGYLTDLYTIPELQFGEEWWDNVINDSLTINGKLYTASSPLHFMSLDLAWVLLFNQDMMDELGLEYPYDLVREGKWTLDKFNEYITGVANLNGDSSFTWDSNGSAVYGIAEHTGSPTAFIYSAGNQLLERDGESFKFVGNTERMYNTVDKLRSLFNVSSGNAYQSNAAMETQSGYLYAFSVDRALFITCELKATLELRDMNSTFGLLPLPKYDESQPDYITSVNHITAFLTIPVTQPDMSRAGTILNALTYESWNRCCRFTTMCQFRRKDCATTTQSKCSTSSARIAACSSPRYSESRPSSARQFKRSLTRIRTQSRRQSTQAYRRSRKTLKRYWKRSNNIFVSV